MVAAWCLEMRVAPGRQTLSFLSTISVIVQSLMFHQFRKNRLSFPRFRHSYSVISGLFRRPTVLSGRDEFDPGLFSVETETQQYVLLGTISGCPKFPVFSVFLFPEISSFIVHHFRIIHIRAFSNNSVLLPLRFLAHHFRIFHHLRKHVRRLLLFMFHRFRKFPSFIFHHFRAIVHFQKIPSCFQFVSQSIISACLPFCF